MSETEKPLPLTTCFPLDLYATAALTGMLANPTVVASIGARAYGDGNADEAPAKLIEAAFHYANYALKVRSGICAGADTSEKTA